MIYLRTSIGIELRGDDMLISSLQSNFSGGTFTHFLRIPGFQLRDRENLRREIDYFFKSKGLSKDNIILGIPRKDVVLRYIDLPSEVADDLKQVIQYQVQSFEPVEEDRYYHDYVLLHNGGDSTRKKLAVLIAMTRKSVLDELLETLLTLGIRPSSVTCSSIGLTNIFLHNRKIIEDKTFILGDTSPLKIEVLVIHNGSLLYSREVSKESTDGWKDLMLHEIDEATSSIRLDHEKTIEKIIFSGESSDTALDEMMTVTTDCELVKSFIDFEIREENLPHVQEAASSLGLAYTGMVRRPAISMNLLPPERRIQQSRWAYVPAAVFGLAIIVLLCALGMHSLIQDKTLVEELNQEIAKLTPAVQRIESLKRQSEGMEKRVKSIETLLNKRDTNLEILRELTTILPSDTYLTTYQYRDGTIQLNGLSASAFDLVPKLEKSPLLKDVLIKGSSYKDPQSGKDRFNIEAKLER